MQFQKVEDVCICVGFFIFSTGPCQNHLCCACTQTFPKKCVFQEIINRKITTNYTKYKFLQDLLIIYNQLMCIREDIFALFHTCALYLLYIHICCACGL